MPALVAPIALYIRDDWPLGPVTLTYQPGPGAAFVPVDLTGASVSANLYVASQASPLIVLSEGAGIMVAADRTLGVLSEVVVPRAVTEGIVAMNRNDKIFATRLQIQVTDTRGLTCTYLVQPILPLEPRFDMPPAPTA